MPTRRTPAADRPKAPIEEATVPLEVLPEEDQAPAAPTGPQQEAPTVEQVIGVLQRERRIRTQLREQVGALFDENLELKDIIQELQETITAAVQGAKK